MKHIKSSNDQSSETNASQEDIKQYHDALFGLPGFEIAQQESKPDFFKVFRPESRQ